ncbi:hypothetical protein TCAL_00022 [Tigriopus californicus]|uniref:G-protein coupled receptors family 1 profile domain-containing protein n=1 Tax=Tigriopus californicus TaxID=6832 RepID=A0A553PHA8_TIGCA|nr:uncharacterized protein LOC131880064 [Tigriopus californicus]TRY77068.1 hypothetical protein TCAL_00022 [Tigriopus californicus]|eukprot:TCALIF_00022-PA protein Name:"Similar to FR FMRFamide receptor (Drosophila melanogaster)" AED:0.27 eAED:0.29 QI:0/-1/0/1/-1/1/1/0/819
MQLDSPEINNFFMNAMIPGMNDSSPDMLSGIAGLSSIAGGFDDAVLDGVVGVGVEALDYPDYVMDPTFDSNFSTIPTLSSPGTSPVDPFIAMTYDRLNCGHFTVLDKKLHFTTDVTETCRFWTEGVFSLVVAAFGLIGNVVSIWVLSVPEMRNSFNRLLLALAIIDCLFILPGILIYTSKAFAWKATWYNYAFPVFLYPFSEIALCSSIYMTVAIAVERYIGLCLPLRRLSRRPCTAKAYIIPVILIALLLNIPKFLESETVAVKTGGLFSNETKTKVRVTDLRTHPTYITYYWMWTRLLATGILPLVVLAILNSKIYLSIRQSKQQLRILAIRSALPMAILSKNAPSVPMSDLAKNKVNPPHGSEDPSTSIMGTNEESEEHGSNDSPRSQVAETTTEEGDEVENRSPLAQRLKSKQPLANGGSLHRIVIQRKAAQEELVNQNGHSPASPSVSGLGQRGVKLGRMVNGQLRQMQRSVSAFASGEPSTAFRKTLRLRRENQAPMLRSNSAAVTSASALSSRVNGHGSAFQSQLLTSSSNLATKGSATATGAGGGSGGGGGGAGANTNDIKLAPILFGVVIVFVLCNSLRVILNIYDFSVVDSIIDCEKKGVGRLPPSWILCSISVSHLLLMVNSSVNFLVYCVAGTRFRRVLVRKVRAGFRKLRKILTSRSKGSPFQSAPDVNRMQNGPRHVIGEARGLLQHDQRRNTTTTLLFTTNPCPTTLDIEPGIGAASASHHPVVRNNNISTRAASLRNEFLLEESETDPLSENGEGSIQVQVDSDSPRASTSPTHRHLHRQATKTNGSPPPFPLALKNSRETSI